MAKLSPLVLVLIAVLLPLVVTAPYLRGLMILAGMYILLATGLNLIIGYVGTISFGHAAFFGIGAYVAGIATERLGWPLILTLPAAVFVAAIASVFIGFATLRISGIYFALASLGFAEIIRLIAVNWAEMTHGPMGLLLKPDQLFIAGSLPLRGDLTFYYLLLAAVLVSLYIVARLRASWIGRAFLAIRENEPLGSSIGVYAVPFKVGAFCFAGMLAAVAGVFYVYYYSIVTPATSDVYYTAISLLMVMVGGRGTLAGPVIGALIFTIVPELARGAGSLRDVVFGAILLIVVLAAPGGLSPALSALWARLGGGGKAGIPRPPRQLGPRPVLNASSEASHDA